MGSYASVLLIIMLVLVARFSGISSLQYVEEGETHEDNTRSISSYQMTVQLDNLVTWMRQIVSSEHEKTKDFLRQQLEKAVSDLKKPGILYRSQNRLFNTHGQLGNAFKNSRV